MIDSGPGVKEEDLPHLFEKFFRGESPKKSGTGLGLSICRGIVEAHGGTIAAKTVKEKGTTFTVTLPVKPKFETHWLP